MKNIVIIHYNTPELTYATIQSVRKFTPGCNFIIFDNSDKRPFIIKEEDIQIIDNTQGQIIDFNDFINKYSNRLYSTNNYASAKHIVSVDYFFDFLQEGFVLLDSDVLIKKDISCFFNENFIWSGEVNRAKKGGRIAKIHPNWVPKRLLPYLLWINVSMCKQYGIRFMSEGRIDRLSTNDKIFNHDTGSSFYEDCCKNNLNGQELKLKEYIEHLGGGSWKNKDYKIWLEKYKELYL